MKKEVHPLYVVIDNSLISPAWNSVKMSGKLSRQAYERFVDSRFKVLQAMVLKNLGYRN